ncbi:WG repeat protein [Nonlabens dokdonensis]|nr:WG repeat-containing protein [Nonlabens dokdonensis]PZX38110.1 WG repeat protein [Nonlabens dokdonensis]
MKSFILILVTLLSYNCYSQDPGLEIEINEMELMEEIGMEEVPLSEMKDKASYFTKGGKYGFVYPEGVFQDPIYDKISFGKETYIVKKGEKYGLTDLKGKEISKIEFDSIGGLYNGFIMKKNGHYGTFTIAGEPILPIQYKKILAFNKQMTFIKNNKNKIQLIFNKSLKIFKEDIEYVELYGNLAIMKSNGNYGVIKEQQVLPFVYDSISYGVSKSPAALRRMRKNKSYIFDQFNLRKNIKELILYKDDKKGIADDMGKIIYPPENDEISMRTSYKYYLVKKGTLNSIYFPISKKKTAFNIQRAYADGVGYVMAVKNGKTGVYDLQGNLIIPFLYDSSSSIRQVSSGLGFKVSKDKKEGIVDKEGNVLVPAIYDEVGSFYDSNFRDYVPVQSNGKTGVVSLDGKLIIPIEYEWIGVENDFFNVMTSKPERKFGIYDRLGELIVPVKYQFIAHTDTRNSSLTVLKSGDKSFNFLNEEKELIFKNIITTYGYVLKEDRLFNPLNSNGISQLYVQNNKGKYGLLNEFTGNLDVAIKYDSIIQKFETVDHTYYSIKKGKKYGLINDANEIILPFKYKDIDLDFISANPINGKGDKFSIVVRKGKKYGAVNLKNEVVIPFQYDYLKRLSYHKLFKAQKNEAYEIIGVNNEPIVKEKFDEIANFEIMETSYYSDKTTYRALTFKDGKMRVITNDGKFISNPVTMELHHGYTTFNELKETLVKALNSPENVLLKEFVDKIAPSQHILFYLKKNIFNDQSLSFTNIDYIKEKYLKELLRFKYSYWKPENGNGYNKSSLNKVNDYTIYNSNIVTNKRYIDHAFGNTKYMEKFLRNSIKVNGYWISTYFMKRGF